MIKVLVHLTYACTYEVYNTGHYYVARRRGLALPRLHPNSRPAVFGPSPSCRRTQQNQSSPRPYPFSMPPPKQHTHRCCSSRTQSRGEPPTRPTCTPSRGRRCSWRTGERPNPRWPCVSREAASASTPRRRRHHPLAALQEQSGVEGGHKRWARVSVQKPRREGEREGGRGR